MKPLQAARDVERLMEPTTPEEDAANDAAHQAREEECPGCGRVLVPQPNSGDWLDPTRWCFRCGGQAGTR